MPKLVRTYCLLNAANYCPYYPLRTTYYLLLSTTHHSPLQAAMWMTKLDTDNTGSIEQVDPNHAVRTLTLAQSHTPP